MAASTCSITCMVPPWVGGRPKADSSPRPRQARRSARPLPVGLGSGDTLPPPADRQGARLMDKPEIFMAPGPVPVPPQVLQAQSQPLVYHRGPGYGKLLRE